MIKTARQDKGLTQVQLGDTVGLTATQVSKIESGATEPDKEVLKKMAKPLGLTQKALLEAAGLVEAAKKTSSSKASSKKETSSAKKTTSSKKETSSAKKTTDAKKTSDSSKKTSSGKTSSAKKTSSSSKKSDSVTLTATEKKLVKLYREADKDTKKDVMDMLEGKYGLAGVFSSLFGGKTEGLGALLGGGKTDDSESAAGSLLQNLAAMIKRSPEDATNVLTLLSRGPEDAKEGLTLLSRETPNAGDELTLLDPK